MSLIDRIRGLKYGLEASSDFEAGFDCGVSEVLDILLEEFGVNEDEGGFV